MKLLVFLHGTLIMHSEAIGVSRSERVRQVRRHDPNVHDYAAYVPVGNAVQKLRSWQKQGADILYLSSHQDTKDVAKDEVVLKRYGFPPGPVYYRQNGESYAVIAQRLVPDVLIEDDCESIGGEQEMTITHLKPEIKRRVVSIVVKEFGGIDGLPDNLGLLQKTLANRDKM